MAGLFHRQGQDQYVLLGHHQCHRDTPTCVRRGHKLSSAWLSGVMWGVGGKAFCKPANTSVENCEFITMEMYL